MEQWYAIVEESTGRLVSVGTVVSEILPLGMIKIPIGGEPSRDEMWSEQQQKFVARPPQVMVDRLDDFLARPGVTEALQTLPVPQRQAITSAIVWLVGSRRFRSQNSQETL